jgi:hypothetical protein
LKILGWDVAPKSSTEFTQALVRRVSGGGETTMKRVLRVAVGNSVLVFNALVLLGLAAGVALTRREL